MTVYKGGTVALSTFVVNGDQARGRSARPNGQVVVSTAMWTRGQAYRVSCVADKVGASHVSCSIHAPTMTASMLVLP
jgi:hypothetical protein